MNSLSIFRVLFLIIVNTGFVLPILGQEEENQSYRERKDKAEADIKKLKEGVLIIRLPSQRNKIEMLQELLDGGKLEEKTEKRIRERLEGTKAKTESFNKSMMTAFYEKYRFSDFLFMLDTASVQLKNGTRQGIFLNKELTIDPSLSLDDRPYFVLRFGTTYSGRGQSIDAMVLMDQTQDDLTLPFPYYVRIHNFDSVMGGLFPKPKQELKNALRLVEKLHKKLVDFDRMVE